LFYTIGGSLLVWKFSATRSTIFKEAARRRYIKRDPVAALVTRS